MHRFTQHLHPPMTPQQLFGTAIRLFAIWLAISSIAYFSSIPSALSANGIAVEGASLATYLVGALYLIAAALLWFFPMLVAHKLVPKTNYTNTLSVPGFELARVGSGLMGLWLLAKALPSLSWVVFRTYLVVGMGSNFSTLPPEYKIEFAVAVFEMLLGVFLIVKAEMFALAIVGKPSTSGESESES